jgi:hypothetical protein
MHKTIIMVVVLRAGSGGLFFHSGAAAADVRGFGGSPGMAVNQAVVMIGVAVGRMIGAGLGQHGKNPLAKP